jgi:hypothetical protein
MVTRSVAQRRGITATRSTSRIRLLSTCAAARQRGNGQNGTTPGLWKNTGFVYSKTKGRPKCDAARTGSTFLDVVLATTIGAVIAAFFMYVGMRGCRNLYHVISNLVGWPFL